MTSRQNPVKKPDPDTLTISAKPDEDESVVFTRTVLGPVLQAAVTLKEYGKSFGDLKLSGLISSLTEQINAVENGELNRSEAMLTAQAHTLDAIFNNLARRAINGEYMDQLEKYLKLALRAQSQCRATWETLATIKNPPVLGYVGQANIAHGPQQVNNTSAATVNTSRARENQNLQNKLLEEKDGERLDTRKAGTPSRADQAMASLGEVDRSQDQSR